MNIRLLIKLAVVAAIYVVFTVLLTPFSYQGIQFRIAEVLVLLCFYRKEYVYSLIVGCFIANINSPMALDIVFGTVHTAISVYIISKMKNLFLASLIPILFMPIIGLELYFILELPILEAMVFPIIGEFIVVSIIGYVMFKYLERNNFFMKLIEANKNWEEKNEI